MDNIKRNTWIFDIETDGLVGTKIHCMSVYNPYTKQRTSLTSYDRMRKFFEVAEVLIGHSIILFDVPQAERLLGISGVRESTRLIDTLALSWYLYPQRKSHGLEAYGEEYGVEKPKVDDWENAPIEDYIFRAEQDVDITVLLWENIQRDLTELYKENPEKKDKIIDYIGFKMDCVLHQEKQGWKLDVEGTIELLERLSREKDDKMSRLEKVMPKVPIYGDRNIPKVMYKKDGSLSAHGESWMELLKEHKLPEDYDKPIRVLKKYKEPNPNSNKQIKDWLYSLGWKPQTYNHKRDKETNKTRKIEQITLPNNEGICPSIQKLYDKEPNLELIEGMSVLSHRIGMLKGFLNDVDEAGYLKAQAHGITNTLRLRHKTLVNLPSNNKPYGKEIRSLLMSPDGYELCGSDVAGLEEKTKLHYIWRYDPEYVKEMQGEDFDAHLDISLISGTMTEEEVDTYKDLDSKKELSNTEQNTLITLKDKRKKGKSVNFSSVYGVGAQKLSLSLDISLHEAKKLLHAYWKRNWSVKRVAKDQVTKKCIGGMWLLNPVSGFWYSLRAEKDIFSTLNQGTGVFVFDAWVKFVRDRGLHPIGQFHDELILLCKEGQRKEIKEVLLESIDQVNEHLNLNVDIGISIDFGKSYAEIH